MGEATPPSPLRKEPSVMDDWDGKERRVHECRYEPKITEMGENIIEVKGKVDTLNVRINGALEKIATHMTEGEGYRKLIIGTAITLVLSIIGGVGTTWVVTSQLGFTMGKFANQIQVNTGRLDKIEAYHEQRGTTRLP
jgi:hypothetical protein